MTDGKQTLVHLGVLGLALVAAVGLWTRDKSAKVVAGDVSVWSGRSGDVERVTFDGKGKKVVLEAHQDAEGRYFTGTVDKDAPPPPPSPHSADAGTPDAGAAPGPARVTLGVVSVEPAEKLADALGSLHALRALGKVGDDRAAEFGLADPEATVTVRIAGAEHRLLLGSITPGGADRYARDAASSEVYVLRGEPLKNLEGAESLLLERELHDWKDAEVQHAHLEAFGTSRKTREIVRGGSETKRFWADAANPDAADETLGNWMVKLERLRPSEYVLAEPEGKELVLRIDYTGKKPLGHVELARVRGDGAAKPTFYLRTEHTRLWGKVTAASAEQLEQDLAGILR